MTAASTSDTSDLAALEHAGALVVGDDLVEQPLFGLAVVQVVEPDVVAEGPLDEIAVLPVRHRFAQRRWERLRLAGLVRVADQLGSRVELVLDAIEPRREHRGEPQVRVHVGAGDPALDAARLAVADDAEAARA